MDKSKNIVLIGMMGCGKTTIAKLLAEKLQLPMLDLDVYLQDKYQQTITEMFNHGEAYFRKCETICCQDVAQLNGYIISTGGGVVLKDENIAYLKENGLIVYIDRPIDNIVSDVAISSRPLLKDGPEKLFELDKQRRQLYLKACDVHIVNDGSLSKIVDDLVTWIQSL